MGARAEWTAHDMSPKSSNSSSIGISFPELSLAFPMLKVAKMDVKVSHSCSDGVILETRKYDGYRPLRLQHVLQHKFCVVVKMDLNSKEGRCYLRPNPYASTLSSLLSSPFLPKNLSGLKTKGSGYTLSSCVIALDVCVSTHERKKRVKKTRHIFANTIVPVVIRCRKSRKQ